MKKTVSLIFMMSIIVSFLGCAQTNMNSDSQFINDYKDPNQDSLLLSLSFDEESGNQVEDKITSSLATINYVFNDAKYKSNEDPQRTKRSAVSGSALAFDGYSNYIEYPSSTIQVHGPYLTIDVFVSPRMFEWDDPYALYNGNENLQVILGQYNKDSKAGFVLGMHKYGNFSFQVGLGDRWVKLWNEWNKLDRYKWNHLTAVYNGETGFMALYKNGEIVNYEEKVFGSIAPANVPLYIGKSHQPQRVGVFELNMFNGLMDELRIYNKALNEEDIYNYHQSYLIDGSIKEVKFEDAWLNADILDDDIYHPKYHATPPQHWMNEPHALFYYKGYYHMFYQFNLTGPYWRQITWGHWVSKDLVRWEHVKEAIVMDERSVVKDGAWSGNMAYKQDGTPVLFITAGDDGKSYGQYSNQNIAIAVPKDLNDPYLTEWEIHDSLVVTHTSSMGRMNEFRDPNVYYEDGVYYMVVSASKHDGKGTALLFTTSDDSFTSWNYEGNLFTPKNFYPYMGSTWELVNLVKVHNESKTLSKYLFVFSPSGSGSDNDVYYYLGDFDKKTKRFIPEHDDPLLMDYGNNVFTGPTIYTEPHSGRVLISSILQDQRTGREHYDAGWAFMAGIPRELSLDDEGNLKVTPIKELDTLKGEKFIDLKYTSLNIANEKLEKVDSSQVYVHLKISTSESTNFGLKIKKDELGRETIIGYDKSTKQIYIDTTNSGNTNVKGIFGGYLELIDDQTLDLEVYIDGAAIECYINGYKTISAMVYNTSTKMEVFADNKVMIDSLRVNYMQSIKEGLK